VASIASALARADLATRLAHLPLSMVRITALLASELVSNAVRHAGMSASQDIILRLRDGDGVRIEVLDEGPGLEGASPHSGGGWGLVLVDQLASSWGAHAYDGGHTVWFELNEAAAA
jgi:two-component sensor histidine kinase